MRTTRVLSVTAALTGVGVVVGTVVGVVAMGVVGFLKGGPAGVVLGYALSRSLHQPGLMGPIGGGVSGFLAAAAFLRATRHHVSRVHFGFAGRTEPL